MLKFIKVVGPQQSCGTTLVNVAEIAKIGPHADGTKTQFTLRDGTTAIVAKDFLTYLPVLEKQLGEVVHTIEVETFGRVSARG